MTFRWAARQIRAYGPAWTAYCDRMAEARKIAKYTFDALLVFVPLAIVLYFLAYPDRFNAFLNWIFGHR